MLDIVLYTDGCFSYAELENYTIPIIKQINESIVEKNEAHKKAMESAKGTNRRTF